MVKKQPVPRLENLSGPGTGHKTSSKPYPHSHKIRQVGAA